MLVTIALSGICIILLVIGIVGFSSNTIEYFGSLLGLLQDSVDYGYKEGLRVPTLNDYPDYRKIEGCINDNFSSYF